MVYFRVGSRTHPTWLKIAANKKDVPYQSLVKVWIDEKLA
jgi:hypothetical protein